VTAAAWLLVSLGTALGAVARAVLDQWLRKETIRRYGLGVGSRFPVGILAINVSGSFVLGLLTGVVSHGLGPLVIAFAATGICGGFTTFSTWAFDTLILARDGERALAAANVGLSVGGGMLAAAAGLGLALL
jgi:CrcB protein